MHGYGVHGHVVLEDILLDVPPERCTRPQQRVKPLGYRVGAQARRRVILVGSRVSLPSRWQPMPSIRAKPLLDDLPDAEEGSPPRFALFATPSGMTEMPSMSSKRSFQCALQKASGTHTTINGTLCRAFA
eukprot:scaffold48_cov311-Pinguiococcus_pyrenoidosus.AAC.93